MSDSIPSSSLSRKRSKRRYDRSKLPTPPPDPAAPDRDDFLAYLDSLQKSSLVYNRSTSYAPVLATEDAFDHLEKLYKLMEQMLELREQNARLHRRVRDLEHLNNLEKMHKELDEHLQDDCPELDKDTAFAETILESILSDSKSPKAKPAASPAKLRQSTSRRRSRSGSVSAATVRHLQPPEMRAERRASDGGSGGGVKKPSKVSKWTKVKAAFKWEKAAPTVSDAKSQDSGLGGMAGAAPVEVARYLRVPSCGGGVDDHGHSPVDSGAAEVSTPGTLSTASSVEDFHRHETRSHCEDFKSSDDEHSHTYIPHSKEGSQKSNKSHKTPWAKMKDIIQTRNSFKKKHRLSAQSDDIQIDVELCTDNEDNVFEEERVCRGMEEGGIPLEVVERYQRAISEDGADSKKISKWTRVKKAFLPPPELAQSPSSSHVKDEDKIEDEIQHNYKQLQKKLSLEFQEKLSEWERMKQNSPNPSNPSSSCGFVEEAKDPAFLKKMEEWQKIKSQPSVKRPNVQMTSEENLPPEFRKKLQEWEKIRKGSGSKKKLSEVPRWKSLSGPKCESPNPEYPNLSEDFRKKLEEWKQMKSASPKQPRKESSPKHGKKQKDELQWFEKELSKIEKEKQRLERERQRFLEREEALSKLRNSVLGGLKKEVLIHTPSGFYRFEGISRKFTQKLYEWEKAKGIGPESSTFALLNSSLSQDSKSQKKKAPNSTPNLMRSKSADSIAISALNLACPLMSHQPSSLSLNDVEELEKECLEISRSSSEKFGHSRETLNEPEALIVEIEDIVEETAGALDTVAQRSQQPVYQREELTLCEGETCAAPKIRRSESTRAQNNYNLIEEIFSILKNLMENETEIQRLQDQIPEDERDNSILIRLKMFDESQKAMSVRLNEKILRLQEANGEVFASLTKDQDCGPKQVLETLENIQDVSTEIYQLTERLDVEVMNRNVYEPVKKGACSLNPVPEIAREIRSKMLELRRRLSYICAASDLTAPRRRHSSPKKKKKTEDSGQNPKEGRLYIKAESSNTQSQGAIKKRIRYRQKSQQSRTLADTDEEEEDLKRNTHKKLTRTRSISEGSAKEEVVVDESIIQKVVVPTQSNIVNVCPDEEMKTVDSPVTVFVKTTRRLFTPLVESSLKEEEQKARDEMEAGASPEDTISENSSNLTSPTLVAHLPPLPSPILQKKTKDISPSIRIMMAKYNQKITEDSHSAKSGNSSGSASPVAWRSPSFERRVKAQTERYQEELKKSSPLLVKKEVQKSASVGVLSKEPPQPRQGPVGVQRILSEPSNKIFQTADGDSKRLSSEIRSQKLQKAKEAFLNSSPKSVPVQLKETPFQFPPRSRLSQISMDSSSSYDSSTPGALMKSASVGMINIDAESYKQFDPEMHGGGYVSLPRNSKKPKEGIFGGKFAFSNIASKFRKVKMRKGKDKMGAVSALCRQSLVVDIQPLLAADGEEKKKSGEEKDAGGWMKKSKLFKK